LLSSPGWHGHFLLPAHAAPRAPPWTGWRASPSFLGESLSRRFCGRCFSPFHPELPLRTRFQIEISRILFHLLSPLPCFICSIPYLVDSVYHGESKSGQSPPVGWGSGSKEDEEEEDA
jgi:hypothetical protein